MRTVRPVSCNKLLIITRSLSRTSSMNELKTKFEKASPKTLSIVLRRRLMNKIWEKFSIFML